MSQPRPHRLNTQGRDRVEEALYTQRMTLAKLMRSPVLDEGDLEQMVRQIAETAAQVLEVERTSVWQLSDDRSAINCLDLYEQSQAKHSSGMQIVAADVPRYFAALQKERAIQAHDARTDARTSEFRSSYLEPLGIYSMLDAPIFVRGTMVGVICHEHVGVSRTWTFSEELLAGTFADFVALAFETVAWRQAESKLLEQRDLLESQVAERTLELRENEANLRSVLEFSPVSMVLTHMGNHKVVYANRRAADMFEIPLKSAIGENAPDYWVTPSDRERFLDALERFGRIDDLQAQLRTRSGRLFWARISAQKLSFWGEDTLLATMVDVTEQKSVQERLLDLARYDALTGVYNRRYLEELLHRELDRAHRYTRSLTVGLLDADHFKRVNDDFGHQVGDAVLRGICERCQQILRLNDMIGRYGGEEFLVIFPETTLQDALVVAERLRRVIADQPIVVGERAIRMTISIGLAAMMQGESYQTLFDRADSALYDAKYSGRNRVFTSQPPSG